MRFCTAFVVTCSLAVFFAGCETIRSARARQRELAPLGADDGSSATNGIVKLSLAGCSLEQLVEFAYTNRPSVVTAALAVKDARLVLREIASDAPIVSSTPWTAPHLSLSGAYSAVSETAENDHGLRLATEGSASANLSLQLLVYDFGRNRAQAEAQAERVVAAEQSFLSAGYAVFEEVASAYFLLMEQDALLEVAQSNVVEYALHLQQAERQFSFGEKQRLDVTRARLDLSKSMEAVIAASNRVATAGSALMKALGVDVRQGDRDEVYPDRNLPLSTVVRGFATTDFDVDSAFRKALESSPSVAVARARLRAASRSVDYAIADLMPSVSAEVGLGWADPIWTWHWGVSAVQSLFQGFRKTTAVDRAVVALESAAEEAQEVEQQLSLDVETAVTLRDNAFRQLETANISVLRAKENLEIVRERFRDGEASRVDYTDAASDYATELGARVSAFYAGQIAEARLFALLGLRPVYCEEIIEEN